MKTRNLMRSTLGTILSIGLACLIWELLRGAVSSPRRWPRPWLRWRRSRQNASERRHACSYCIHALPCPLRTPPGVSSGCAHWDHHGTVSPCRTLFRSVSERSHADPLVGRASVFILWFGLGNAATIALVFYAATFPVIFKHLDRRAIGQSPLDSLR